MVSASIVNNTRQSRARNRGHAFERLYVASAGFRKCRQLEVDLPARSNGKLAPLAGGSGSECDLFHTLKSHNAINKSSYSRTLRYIRSRKAGWYSALCNSRAHARMIQPVL
jgi:hypothetical protein